jgi:enamine deaminase RidA (YjgF/YER057c/UK114 family)
MDTREAERMSTAEGSAGAEQRLQDVFGKQRSPCRLVYGVARLPLGVPVELEVIFEVGESGGPR